MQTINVRTLQRNMKAITEKVRRGQSFTVFKNSTMVFQINPVTDDLPESEKDTQKKLTTLDDVFRNVQMVKGNKHASQQIDDIVYG